MRRVIALSSLLVLGAPLASCGPERRFSGLWRQAGTFGHGEHAYELHLGRFGDGVAGLVVRYAVAGDGLDVFDPPNECGCFYISGGKASDDGFKFTLFDPGVPGQPSAGFTWSRACVPPGAAGPRPAPEGCVFDLRGGEEALSGHIECDEAQREPIEFVRVGSSTRTNCVVP